MTSDLLLEGAHHLEQRLRELLALSFGGSHIQSVGGCSEGVREMGKRVERVWLCGAPWVGTRSYLEVGTLIMT